MFFCAQEAARSFHFPVTTDKKLPGLPVHDYRMQLSPPEIAGVNKFNQNQCCLIGINDYPGQKIPIYILSTDFFCEQVRGVRASLTRSQKQIKEVQGMAGDTEIPARVGGRNVPFCEQPAVFFRVRPARKGKKGAFLAKLPPGVGGDIMIGAICCGYKWINTY